MSRLPHTLVFATLACAAVISTAPTPFAGTANAGSADGTRCEIRVSKRGGMTTLEGFVIATAPIQGSYRISVTTSGGGGSDIDQSGAFEAKPGAPVSLGVVSVGGSPGGYAAGLTVKWDGGSTRCN